MGLFAWAEERAGRLKWYDTKLAQWAAIFVVLAIVSGWPASVPFIQSIDWYWYIVGAIVTGGPVARRFLVG